MVDSSFSRYLIVGVGNTLVGLSVIYACKWLLDMGDIAANITGYAIGLTFSFLINRRWTFEHVGPFLPAAARFIIVIMVAYSSNLFVVLFSIDVLHINSYLAHAIGIGPYLVIGYLGSRYFAFRGKNPAGEGAT